MKVKAGISNGGGNETRGSRLMSVMESSFELMKYSFLSRDRKRGDMMAVVLLDGLGGAGMAAMDRTIAATGTEWLGLKHCGRRIMSLTAVATHN